MSADLSLDIAALVGEMVTLPCEHSEHGTGHNAHDDGPATHYVRGHHHCVGSTPVYAACSRMVQRIIADEIIACGHCNELTTTGEVFTILGPVNG